MAEAAAASPRVVAQHVPDGQPVLVGVVRRDVRARAADGVQRRTARLLELRRSARSTTATRRRRTSSSATLARAINRCSFVARVDRGEDPKTYRGFRVPGDPPLEMHCSPPYQTIANILRTELGDKLALLDDAPGVRLARRRRRPACTTRGTRRRPTSSSTRCSSRRRRTCRAPARTRARTRTSTRTRSGWRRGLRGRPAELAAPETAAFDAAVAFGDITSTDRDVAPRGRAFLPPTPTRWPMQIAAAESTLRARAALRANVRELDWSGCGGGDRQVRDAAAIASAARTPDDELADGFAAEHCGRRRVDRGSRRILAVHHAHGR